MIFSGIKDKDFLTWEFFAFETSGFWDNKTPAVMDSCSSASSKTSLTNPNQAAMVEG